MVGTVERCAVAPAVRKGGGSSCCTAPEWLPDCHTNHLSSWRKQGFGFSRSGTKTVRACCVAYAEAGAILAPGTAMSEGMLASCSNSTAKIRRTWMSPPADLPSSRTDETIPTNPNFASSTERDRTCGAGAYAPARRARMAAFSSGRNRNLNDDGVANADTPPSTSQTGYPSNRHARAAARPLDFQFPC